MNKIFQFLSSFIFLQFSISILQGQSAMINVDARKTISLDGDWQAIIDPGGGGDWRKIWEEKKPVKKTDFVEYAFTDAYMLHVYPETLTPKNLNCSITKERFGIKRHFIIPRNRVKDYFFISEPLIISPMFI